ncbi:MAG: NUDIX domain-containing protein [Gammaproteobacteria bacterium]
MTDRVRILSKEVLSDDWYTLNKFTFEYRNRNNEWQTQKRESYDRGNGAAILLFNKPNRTVVLIRQFRLPSYLNGNTDGMMVEVCAGLLDGDNPHDCIIKEVEEETGYRIKQVEPVLVAFMSPGAVTEKIHFFLGEYDASDKVSDGGGLASEQEDIEVLELDFERAYDMIAEGIIQDAKTIMLLQHARLNGVFE